MKAHPVATLLIARFPELLETFEQNCPFTASGQLDYHLETIKRRRELASVGAALADLAFLRSLYETLRAWGIGVRASRLKPFDDFVRSLRAREPEISALGERRIDEPVSTMNQRAAKLQSLIQELGIVDNKAVLVAGSKALHHLLPELVVPIDREYTRVAFAWEGPKFQGKQDQFLCEALAVFGEVARSVDLMRYVDGKWNSSRTKVIDNAVVGYVLDLKLSMKTAES